jgi:hypothetical protein
MGLPFVLSKARKALPGCQDIDFENELAALPLALLPGGRQEDEAASLACLPTSAVGQQEVERHIADFGIPDVHVIFEIFDLGELNDDATCFIDDMPIQVLLSFDYQDFTGIELQPLPRSPHDLEDIAPDAGVSGSACIAHCLGKGVCARIGHFSPLSPWWG